jgi:hypothetical protein
MKALLLAMLSLVALGCGSAEPVSASPDAAGDVVSTDVATASEDAPEASQDAAVAVAVDAAPEAAAVVPQDVAREPDVAPGGDASPLSDTASDARRVEGDRPCVTVRDCGTLRPSMVPSCQAGQCVDVCPANFADCDGDPSTGCEVRLDRRETCGSCTTACRGMCVRWSGGVRCS